MLGDEELHEIFLLGFVHIDGSEKETNAVTAVLLENGIPSE